MKMMNTASTTTETIRFFTFNHIKKQIIGSQFNFDKAGIFGTDQYTALMTAMEKHPNYALSPIAPVKEKQTYQGLTKKFMEAYINAIATDEIKAQYNKYIERKCHFATIKSWFLDEYQGFTMENARQEMRKYAKNESKKNLVAVKLAVHTAVKEELSKKQSTVPFPNNKELASTGTEG